MNLSNGFSGSLFFSVRSLLAFARHVKAYEENWATSGLGSARQSSRQLTVGSN